MDTFVSAYNFNAEIYVFYFPFTDVHEASFIVFMACAMSFMLLHCILYRVTATQPMSDEVKCFEQIVVETNYLAPNLVILS